MATNFLTPVARLVLGDLYDPQTKDAEGQPLVIKSGPNAGQSQVRYYMGIAIRKDDPGWNDLITAIYAEARAAFPAQFDPSGNCVNLTFAFKIIDGDSTQGNSKGVRPCDREGYSGHYVLNFSGTFPPKVFGQDHKEIATVGYIKRGYFVRIHGNVRGNDSELRPGVFLNYEGVEFVAYGDELHVGKSGEEMFGATAPGALPPGASMTPLAAPAAPGVSGPVPPATAPAVVAPVAVGPAPNVAVGPAPGATVVAPAPSFLNPGPAAQGAAPTPPAVAEPMYTVEGAKYTRAQLLGFGWTDAQIDAIIPF